MDDPATLRRARCRALFLGAAGLVVFVRILPIDPAGGGIPAPDGLTLLVFAWMLRRPGDLPVWMVAAVALFADVVFMRPPGLWALLTVAGSEVLRRRARMTGEQPFVVEWVVVAALLGAMTLARVVILGVTLVPQPPLGAILVDAAVTIAAYPVVVLACVWGLGLRTRNAEVRP